MFSNKHRIGKIALLFALIIGLCYYGYLTGPDTELTFQECMANPAYYDGTELIIGYHKVGRVNPDHFELQEGNEVVKVIGDPHDAIVGDYVSAKAVYKEGGYLVHKDFHVHKYRRLKYVLSILPIPFVLWFFIREFTITKKGFRLK